MTVTEIATALGVSKQYVHKLLTSALMKLRRYHQAQRAAFERY